MKAVYQQNLVDFERIGQKRDLGEFDYVVEKSKQTIGCK
jgi:hypothetical protein